MCGIVGAISERNIEKVLIEGLKRLEYRGYDSAGLALLNLHKKIERLRTEGKVRELENLLSHTALHGKMGIAHTRWATHGAPSEANAHPLMSNNQIALVHNGIIENHDKLRVKLLEEGYEFVSQTDTETVVHLLHYHFADTNDLLKATQRTVAELQGAYALGIMSTEDPTRIIAVRSGAPLIVGLGHNENFFASDILALGSTAKEFIYLEEGDIADITLQTVSICNSQGERFQRKINPVDFVSENIDRGEHRHFMSKEILEQPRAIQAILEDRTTRKHLSDTAFGANSKELFKKTEHVHLVACGTSYHAALVARYWLESIAGIPATAEIASEFRYRKPVVNKNSLFVTLSQSGETADTLAALKLAKGLGFLATLGICNVAESSLVRESQFHFMTRAGIEIGVASTKAFTAQLASLLMLTLAIAKEHNFSPEMETKIIENLYQLPAILEATLKLDAHIKNISTHFIDKNHALFLGRGTLFPIALEGALKLKEISYIHAEGYPAGELKHGPLALVDRNMPVIAIAPHDELLEKIKSNLQEVGARGGELFILTDSTTGVKETPHQHIIELPVMDPMIAPIAYTIPLQLLAYHVAQLKGTDVDQPRNLAKSVTVE